MSRVRSHLGRQAAISAINTSVVEAAGCILKLHDCRTVVDLYGASGVNSLGHNNITWLSAVDALTTCVPTGPFATAIDEPFHRSVSNYLPVGQWQAYSYSAGCEAVEAALRAACSITGHRTFAALAGSFHGRSEGARAVSDDLDSYAARSPDAVRLAIPSPTLSAEDALARNEEVLVAHGPVAAVVVEPVLGRAGNKPIPHSYLLRLSELSRRLGSLFIIDEIITGGGRCGDWSLAVRDALDPDCILLGKGIGNGYPISLFCLKQELAEISSFSEPSAASSSYGAYPRAKAAVVATATEIERDGLHHRSEELGAIARSTIDDTAEWPGLTTGRGLAIGIPLTCQEEVVSLHQRLIERGVLVMTGRDSVRLYPPLNIPEDLLVESAITIGRTLRNMAFRSG